MMEQNRSIIWNGETIGRIDIIGAEMNNLYGHWHPSASDKVEPFLQRLENGQNVSVQIQNDTGVQDCLVTDMCEGIIEIRLENKP
jgi:hypothetical protein